MIKLDWFIAMESMINIVQLKVVWMSSEKFTISVDVLGKIPHYKGALK